MTRSGPGRPWLRGPLFATSLIVMTLLAAVIGLGLFAAPSSSMQVKAFDVIDIPLAVQGSFKNPYNPDEVQVEGLFRHPSGREIRLPAFWDGSRFVLRFSPVLAGDWTLTASVRTAGGAKAEPPVRIRAEKPSSEGFVRPAQNPRYFAFDSGRSFFMVGLNLCWPDSAGTASYERMFGKLASNGGSFARIWTNEDRKLETAATGCGRYDQKALGFYDQLFRLAQAKGIRLMWTLDDYRVLAKDDYFVAHWDKSPYSVRNGGPLKEPLEFFSNEECRRLYRQKLRYLVARYSAFTSLAFWEIWNEQDNIPKPGVPLEWFRAMTDALKALDPYGHVITTSYSWDDRAEVWRCPAVGLTQRHMYSDGSAEDFVDWVAGNAKKMEPYGRPTLIGEFGITWKEPDLAMDKAKKGTALHNALWASLMTGHAGTALSWWWDNYIEPAGLWSVYKGISAYAAGVDFARSRLAPLAGVKAEGLKALALQDPSSGETLIWVLDPKSTWKSDSAGWTPSLWKEAVARVPVPSSGRWKAEFWDTRTGKIMGFLELEAASGGLAVPFPPFERDAAVKIAPAR